MKKLTTSEFIEKAKLIHGDKYDYSLSNYTKTNVKLIIICPIHGKFNQTPDCHTNSSQGCPSCSGNLRSTSPDFIRKSNIIHEYRYNYSEVNYVNNMTDVILICKHHGKFKQKPKYHLRGNGCFKCKGKEKINHELFLKKSNTIHNYKYRYYNDYINYTTKIDINCPLHGNFKQLPVSHAHGKGCPHCSNRCLSNTPDFIEKAKEIHGKQYDYSTVNYMKSKIKVSIKCLKCNNIFLQKPNDHLSNYGCPTCSPIISKPETKFLDYLTIVDDKIHRQYRILNYKVDGFNPYTNTSYEFLGDYWHGNPKIFLSLDINKKNKMSFGFLYIKTLERFKRLYNNGIKIHYIWENDWDNWNKIDELSLNEYMGGNII